MLPALQKLDPSEALSVLATAARSLLPQPDAGDQPVDENQKTLAEAPIGELQTSRGRQSSQNLPTTVQEALSKEISSFLLKDVDPHVVRARLGAKGALSTSLYEVT